MGLGLSEGFSIAPCQVAVCMMGLGSEAVIHMLGMMAARVGHFTVKATPIR